MKPLEWVHPPQDQTHYCHWAEEFGIYYRTPEKEMCTNYHNVENLRIKYHIIHCPNNAQITQAFLKPQDTISLPLFSL